MQRHDGRFDLPGERASNVERDGDVTIQGIGARRLQRQIENHFEEVDGLGCGTPYRGDTLSCTVRAASAHATDSDDTLVEMTDGPGIDHVGTLGDRFSCNSETTFNESARPVAAAETAAR